MANGDAAALEGFDPVPGSKDIRQGYDDINRLADWAAGRTKGRPIGAAGLVSLTPSGSGPRYQASVTVTLPTGRFSSAPSVVLSCETGTTTLMSASPGSISATSFDINFWRESTTATNIDWIAVARG